MDKRQLMNYPLPGNVIANYRLDDVIEITSHWCDYKATHTIHSKPYVLRVMEKRYSSSANFMHRFRRESKISARLQHPNIYSLVSAGKFGEYYYLVQEYKQIKKLENIINPDNRMPADNVIELGLQLADALIYAHKNKVLHRNISPKNVVIDTDGSALLSDFGLSALLDQPQSGDTLDKSFDLQNVLYQAPELTESPPEASERSDIYSLCAVLYFAAAGESAFNKVQDKLLGVFRELDSLVPNIPDKLVEVIHKGLEQDKANRYKNAVKLKSAFTRIK